MDKPMRTLRLAMLGVLLAAGCANIVGPFQRRTPVRVDDPLLPISDQERRGRANLALWNDETDPVPKTYSDRPDPLRR
jgi:hypothetical protein